MAVDRHINFFELQKVCGKEGCPLCRIVADRARRYLDNMLFEHVSDRAFRAAHRASGGFCPAHSKDLASFRDGLAVAILGRDILEDRITAFKKRKPWRPKDRCPICAEGSRIEAEYLGFLAEASGDSQDETELKAAFTASEGLCAPHYGLLMETRKRIPSWLRDFQEGKFDALLARTGRFIELSAYGRQDEFRTLSEADQLVWKELARSLRGTSD